MKDEFGDRLFISMYDSRRGDFVYNSNTSEAEARATLYNDEEKHLHMIRSADLQLRSLIQAMLISTTPSTASVEILKSCLSELPEKMLTFYKTLVFGLQEHVIDSNEAMNRRVMTMASDAVFNASRGTVRPWKHTVLGRGLGTLTGSKMILRILNRLGHCRSYDEIKALKTEFAYTAEMNDRDAPDGVSLEPNRGTGLACDNYDVNMDTIDGKDTLHTTVGICYQSIQDYDSMKKNDVSPVNVPATSSGRKRHYDGKEQEIEPYYQQLQKAQFDLSAPYKESENAEKLCVLDFYWLLQSEIEK